jgi:hypothetical protein
MLCHGVTVALVPWLLDSSSLIYGRRSRPLPGQDRRGEPVRPVARRPLEPASKVAGHASHGHGGRAPGGSGTPVSAGQSPVPVVPPIVPPTSSATTPEKKSGDTKKVPARAKR